MAQTITIFVPSKRRPLQSGDRWRCSITDTGFRSSAIFPLAVDRAKSSLVVHEPINPCNLEMGNPEPKHNPEYQYHHYIPRFILKRFTTRQSKQPFPRSQRKPPRIEELICCYNASESTGVITERLVSKTYGVQNLYRDVGNPESAYDIESKLSSLESEAGKMISGLLATVAEEDVFERDLSFEMTRRNHNRVRKFMHIMYYRKHDFAKAYWKEDDPENAHLRSWILGFCKRKNIKPDAVSIWLHVLRYYLDTPHPDIIDHGRKARGEDCRQRCDFPHTRYAEIDPSLEHWQAVRYSDEADGFFLAIWEAAPGEEFILSENSFGLFEGSESPFGPIHRFYIISPRIALVLCSVGLGFDGVDPGLRKHCRQSKLWEASHKPPKITYAKKPPEFRDSRERLEFEAGENHWENDKMEFKVSTLSIEHTHIVNAIILGNTNDNGLITFRSKEAILRTLDSFGDNTNFGNQSKYAPLVRELLEGGESNSFEILRFDSEEDFLSKYEKLQATGQENSGEHLKFLKEYIRRAFVAASDPSTAVRRITAGPCGLLYPKISSDPHPSGWPLLLEHHPPSPPTPLMTQPALARPTNSNLETIGNCIPSDPEEIDEPKNTIPSTNRTPSTFSLFHFIIEILGWLAHQYLGWVSIRFTIPLFHSPFNRSAPADK